MFPVLLKQGSFNKHASLGSSSCGFVSRMLFSKLVFSFFQTWRWQGSSLLTDQTYFLVSETCMFVKLPSFRGPRTWALVYSFQYRDNVKSKATAFNHQRLVQKQFLKIRQVYRYKIHWPLPCYFLQNNC